MSILFMAVCRLQPAKPLRPGDAMNNPRREALLKEYSEVCNNFRLLTDIRFKLLGFLPIATAATAAIKGDSINFTGFTLSLFGLAATLGLAIYNERNDQLYDELSGRAQVIERSVGLPDGNFANRPRAWLSIGFGKIRVNHETGIRTIYAAAVALWLAGTLAPIFAIALRVYLSLPLPYFVVADPSKWINAVAIVVAILLTYIGTRWIQSEKKKLSDELRSDADRAVKHALMLIRDATVPIPFDKDVKSEEVRLQTAAERNTKFLAVAKEDDALLRLCEDLSGEVSETLKKRMEFYASIDADSLGYYLPHGSDDHTAAHLVALLTNMPPQWLLDCRTNRHGKVASAGKKP
jgi:hypothetical protein